MISSSISFLFLFMFLRENYFWILIFLLFLLEAGKLPVGNNISWRGDSGLKDGIVGGYYDGGDAIKYHFPMSFAITMLSWSTLEYERKYRAAGEFEHVTELIRWGTDYLLRTFNSSASDIDELVIQVITFLIN